jgi:hypothetical protein
MIYFRDEENTKISADSSHTQSRYVKSGVIRSLSFSASVGYDIPLAEADGPLSLDLGGITEGTMLIIETDAQVTVSINSEDITMKPIDANTPATIKFLGSSITTLIITNPIVDSTANLTIEVAGT